MDGNRILYKGKEVAFPLELGLNVIDGRGIQVKHEGESKSHPMWFEGREFATTPRAIVTHWTAGENGAKGVYHTLENRNLSIHFVIDGKGVITQMADVATRCAHASIANSYSVGIEISNRGRFPALPRVPRASIDDRIHGRPVKCLQFFPEQVTSAHKLIKALCQLLNIPYKFPMDGNGKVKRIQLFDDELSKFTGVLGHLHISSKKTDPGGFFMDELVARG